jgi:hypothetical protein
MRCATTSRRCDPHSLRELTAPAHRPLMAAGKNRGMTLSTIAIVNGALALLILLALARVLSLGLRIHRRTNEESIVPAEPTPLYLHEEMSKAA